VLLFKWIAVVFFAGPVRAPAVVTSADAIPNELAAAIVLPRTRFEW
jgi:hypothetical protein